MILVEVLKTFCVLQIHPFLVHIHKRSQVKFALADNLRFFVLFLDLKLDLSNRREAFATNVWVLLAFAQMSF